MKWILQFPLDSIKIDRSFVKEIESNNHYFTIISTIIVLGHSFGLSIVAEGVETEEQYKILKGLDCDYAQGFYFAKPMSSKKIEDLIQQRPDWKLDYLEKV